MSTDAAAEPLTQKLRRYGSLNMHDALKLLALALMAVDHVGWAAYPHELWLRAIGRACAPIFFFLIGYARSYHIRIDLVLCAVALAVINAALAHSLLNINILVSFIIARLGLSAVEKGRLTVARPWDGFVLLAVLFPSTLLFHYGTPGLLFAYFGYLQRHSERYKAHDRLGILIGTCILYAALESWLFHFSLGEMLLCAASVAGMGWLLWRYRPYVLTLPPRLRPYRALLAWPARYSLWIYTLHLAAIQLVTKLHY